MAFKKKSISENERGLGKIQAQRKAIEESDRASTEAGRKELEILDKKEKKLAKISGVSVRTLHYHGKIALLKPFAKCANNYRSYEKEQLLHFQQILFFKELGFALN